MHWISAINRQLILQKHSKNMLEKLSRMGDCHVLPFNCNCY